MSAQTTTDARVDLQVATRQCNRRGSGMETGSVTTEQQVAGGAGDERQRQARSPIVSGRALVGLW
jgi:hypothetical protein